MGVGGGARLAIDLICQFRLGATELFSSTPIRSDVAAADERYFAACRHLFSWP